jgi:hypothetical protein
MGCRFSDKVRKNSAPGCGSLLVKRFHGKRILDSKSEAIQTETSGPASEKVCSWDRNRMKQEHFHRSTYVARSSWHLMAFHVRDRLTSCAEALQVFARKDSSAIFEGCSLCIIRCLANFPYLLAGRFELHLWTSCSFFLEILRSCSARASAEASTFTPNHD